ncbi:dopamine receptor D2 like isoform X1 [Pungitius pungitius]|uniref:dopamine receptor D2 like isoform X1 n=1 Tax=Pungitius pungitius TaxID=134920 RepID=UPI002E12EBDB
MTPLNESGETSPPSFPFSSVEHNSSLFITRDPSSFISSPSPSTWLTSSNCTGSPSASSPPYNFYAVLLVLLIFCVVFGNVLVCVAVSRERALQTTTNYLIVSLAVSDLLLATLVMPWGVYLEVVGEWRFSLIHCDILLTLDVMMCTASILNLCAISIDRYTAVAMPMLYNTRYSSRRRVAVMISVVWFLSFAISCPLLFGLNNTASRDGTTCSFADPAFVVYSSVASFYVPFIVTLLVYAQICVVLRKRGRRTAPPRGHGLHAQGAAEAPEGHRHRKSKCTQPEDVKLCTLYLRPTTAGPQRKKVTLVKEAVVHPLEVEPGRFLPRSEQSLAPPPAPQAASHSGLARISLAISVGPAPVHPATVTRSALMPRPPTLEDGMRGREGWRERSGGRDKWGVSKERVRGRLSQQKERKATQMLAIVLERVAHACSALTHLLIRFLSPVPRRVHHLLAAVLPHPRAEGPLQQLLHHALTVQRCHLAGVPQQRRQPRHLHHLQHRVSQSLHQDPALLRGRRGAGL